MAYGRTFTKKIYYHAPFFLKNLISSFYGLMQQRKRYGQYYRQYLKEIEETPWLSGEELRVLQFRKTKDFLVKVVEFSPFYRQLFREHNFDPGKMNSLDDLAVLPVMEKERIRKNLKSILPKNFRGLKPIWSHTSGTTGEGLVFPLSPECFQREYAFRTLHFLWGGIRVGDKIAACAGHPVTYYHRQLPPFWCYDFVNNWLLLSSYHLTEKNLPYYINELAKFQPQLLKGYPSSIYLLALANKKLGQKVRPRAIHTASETLLDFQRRTIEDSFGCKVYMWYGTAEMVGNIVECDKGNYHLKEEHSFIEVLDSRNRPVPDGWEGRVIGTGFGNLVCPFIRYSLEDVVVLSKKKNCSCGRGGRIVRQVVGRTEDYIVTADGRFVGRLDHIFKDSFNVNLAQLVQENVNEIIIRIVKTPNYKKKDENDILKEARDRLGPGINIDFDYVDDIPRGKSGKFHFIVSKLKNKKIFDTTVDI
jgi:phenylacetate-CoA ligase